MYDIGYRLYFLRRLTLLLQHQLPVTIKVLNAIKAFNAVSVKFTAPFMVLAAHKFNPLFNVYMTLQDIH